jgi:putative polymerase
VSERLLTEVRHFDHSLHWRKKLTNQATHEYSTIHPAITKVISTDRGIRLPFALVFGALTFNFFLCFINTNVTDILPVYVIAMEVLIVSIAFLASVRTIGQKQFTLICATFMYLFVLMLIRANLSGYDEIDPKVFRDFMVPFAFFLLGTRIRDLRSADFMVLLMTALVVVVAVFEYFFVELYVRYFNIIMYYVARGSVATERLEILSTNLFESGIRPEGRVMLPVLGDHRVSSIFLEPVSPGNFAVIVFFWALVRAKFRTMLCAVLFLFAIFLIIMADNRFGAFLCVSALGLILLPSRLAYAPVACAPFLAMGVLLGVGHGFGDFTIDNSFLGRLVLSGGILLAFDLPTWLGIGESARTAFDSGYGYVISQIGLIGFVGFWLVFMTLKGATSQFFVFRSLTGLYFAAVLCVSYSPLTIKTAALLWLLLGALAVARLQYVEATGHRLTDAD